MKRTLLLFLTLTCCAFSAAQAQLTGAANPDAAAGNCRGIDILFIVDASSTMDGEEAQFLAGFNGFLEGIHGRGNHVAVAQFGTAGSLVFPYTEIVNGAVDLAYNYNPPPIGGNTQYTNYEAGFLAGLHYVDGNPSTNYGNTDGGLSTPRWPDLTIFFTDGEPNRSVNDNGTVNVCGDLFGLLPSQSCADAAVPAADALKGAGSHIFVASVGTTQYLLNEITGPNPEPWDLDFNTSATADYIVVGQPSDLAGILIPLGAACTAGLLPVELTSFEPTVDGNDVLLRWTTASETNNAGFEIQHRDHNAASKDEWQVLNFIDGFGTTIEPRAYSFRASDLAPGSHTFRLRQVDFDGAFEYSPEVEVIVDLAETYVLEAAYPNPFNPEATMRFAVAQAQQVEVALFNTLGQRVKTLYTGMAESGQMQTVQIDGSDLPSGMYLIRVQGERFAETQAVTLLK